MLDYGADVNCLDADKRTPLHHAADGGIVWAVDLLIRRGASTHLKDGLAKKTPIELATNYHIKELILSYSQSGTADDTDELKPTKYTDVEVTKRGQIKHPDFLAKYIENEAPPLIFEDLVNDYEPAESEIELPPKPLIVQ